MYFRTRNSNDQVGAAEGGLERCVIRRSKLCRTQGEASQASVGRCQKLDGT